MPLPKPLEELIVFFQRYPGIGRRSAMRLIWTMLERGTHELHQLIHLLQQIADQIVECSQCHNIDVQDPCWICRDPSRDPHILCVVPTFQDVYLLEETGSFAGRYHVLGGLLSPIEGKTPETLNIATLLQRVHTGTFREIFLAIPPSPEGEITIQWLAEQLPQNLKLTVLARGIQPVRTLDYTDPLTLQEAVRYRIPYPARESTNDR